jgi:Resolvase, N terminal domain
VTRRSLLHAVLDAPAEPSAVIYLHISTKAQGQRGGEVEGFSIPAQRAACLRKAESLGAKMIGEFVDAGDSARSADRPELQRRRLKPRHAVTRAPGRPLLDLRVLGWSLLRRRVVGSGQKLVYDCCEGRFFLLAEGVEHQPPHRHDVAGSSLLDRSTALSGNHDESPAAVLGAFHTPHQATTFHALDVMGDPAALPMQQPSELGDPHPTLGIVGEVDQDLEVRHRQADVLLQLALQRRGQLCVQLQPAAPKVLLLRGQPSNRRAHVHHRIGNS